MEVLALAVTLFFLFSIVFRMHLLHFHTAQHNLTSAKAKCKKKKRRRVNRKRYFTIYGLLVFPSTASVIHVDN